jgi:L-lactate utilization protein LutB
MRKHARALLVSSGLILGGVGIGAYVIPGAAMARDKDDKERHPHIHRALEELREARKELKEADHDFKGHREEALEAVDKAIKQLDICLKVDKK